MILKYRGYMNNWCYMEAQQFTVGRVVLKDVPPCDINLQELSLIERDYRFKEKQIREEIGLENEPITLLIGNELFESGREYVVVLAEKDQREAFVLSREAYLMTDNGKTIERIA